MAIAVQQEGGIIGGLGSIYKWTWFFWLQGQMAMPSITLKLNTIVGGAPSDNMGDVLLPMYNNIQNTMKLGVSSSAVCAGSKLSQIYPKPAPLSGIVSDGGACAGGSGCLPLVVSGIIKTNTAVAGRAYRGRVYVPFPYAASVDTDFTPTSAYVTKLLNIANAWITSVASTPNAVTYNFIPVIWHRKAGKSGVPPALSYDAVVGSFSEKVWTNQHRRGSFGKLNPDIIH